MIKRRIYISPASDENLNPDQRAIKRAILHAIEEEGFEPLMLESRNWSFDRANQDMSRCQGAVILAFARWPIDPHYSLTSEYNHFDGALAFSHKVPLLIVANDNVRTAGVLLDGQVRLVVLLPVNGGLEWINNKYPGFSFQFKDWCTQVTSRPDVFLGYCSKARNTAIDIARYLERDLKLIVHEYSKDFRPGGSILERIEEASRDCTYGVFLFTKDDEQLEGGESHAAPRDNVIFEAGYFMHAKGKERVLVIREEGAKMPADLGGNIYIPLHDRNNISDIHTQLRQFLENRL
jgi:CAP12/Pycsar effector protein, TIR domain